MLVRRYTPGGKWSKPIISGTISNSCGRSGSLRIGEFVKQNDPQRRKDLTITNSLDNFILTITRDEFNFMKEWFEG